MGWVHTPTHTQAHIYTHVGTFKHSVLGAASASTSSTHSRAKSRPSQTVLFIQYDCVYHTQQELHAQTVPFIQCPHVYHTQQELRAWLLIICISKSCIHLGYGMTIRPIWTTGKQKSFYSSASKLCPSRNILKASKTKRIKKRGGDSVWALLSGYTMGENNGWLIWEYPCFCTESSKHHTTIARGMMVPIFWQICSTITWNPGLFRIL